MNLIIFIIGSLVHLAAKYLDIASSRRFTKLGITESNPLFRDANKMFSEWRAWFAVLLWQFFATTLYLYGADNDPSGTFHPLYSLGVFALSTAMSIYWYFRNERRIREANRNPKFPGGVI